MLESLLETKKGYPNLLLYLCEWLESIYPGCSFEIQGDGLRYSDKSLQEAMPNSLSALVQLNEDAFIGLIKYNLEFMDQEVARNFEFGIEPQYHQCAKSVYYQFYNQWKSEDSPVAIDPPTPMCFVNLQKVLGYLSLIKIYISKLQFDGAFFMLYCKKSIDSIKTIRVIFEGDSKDIVYVVEELNKDGFQHKKLHRMDEMLSQAYYWLNK